MPAPATDWAAAVSERSAHLLAAPPREATVLAAFPSALYLHVDDGLLPVLARGALRLPTAVVVAGAACRTGWGVQPGDAVGVGGGMVVLPRVTVRAVRQWRPRRMPVAPGVSPVHLVSWSPSRWREDAAELAGRVVAHEELRAVVRRLVGSGPGLTPSGDDVLCGVLLGLRLLGRAAELPRVWEAVVPRLASTTTLGAALLVEALQGFAVPPVISLGQALAAGDEGRVRRALEDVLAIGHSSGADLLAGLAGCLDALQDPATGWASVVRS